MKYLFLITLMSLAHLLFGQTELVADINEGPEDCGVFCDYNFTLNQDCAVKLGEKFIFQATNETVGRELYVLENGEVELIMDLNNDASDSDPRFLTPFQGAVYFTANDNTGYKIWRTDGTAAGTEIAFDLGVDDAGRSEYTVFLINGDKLYFDFQGVIYVFDGQDLIQVQYDSDIFIHGSSAFNSFGWCTYKDGIAIMDYNDESWDLLYIHDGIVDNLLNFQTDDSFRGPYGMAAFEGGMSFSFEASFDDDIEGRYLYLDGSNEAVKQSDDFTTRVISINDESSLLYTKDEFILFDKNNLNGTKVLSGVLNFTQGEDWNRILVGEYLAFQSAGGVFEDTKISLMNASDGTISTIYEGDDLTKIYAFGDYIIFFAESLNDIFDKALFIYDMTTSELRQFVDLVDLPFNSDLHPIGIQGEYLYFYGNVDDAFGVEIYKIKVDINTSVKNIDQQSNFSFLQIASNTFQFKTELEGQFEVEVYNNNGQLIKSQIMLNNHHIEIPYTGLIHIKTKFENFSQTQMKFVFKQ